MKGMAKKYWVPLLILAGGFVLAAIVTSTGPEAPRRSRQRQARLVEVTTLERGDAQVIVEAMGTVRPAREVEMKALVSGEVVELGKAFLPGGRVRKGETLLRLDARDYEFAVRQRESELALKSQALKLEEGQQSIARREYELLGDVLEEDDAELVLRRPQWETARTAEDAARASLEQARLNLGRTRVVAPFNAVVESKLADLGAVLTANTTLGVLVGTDAAWVEVLVPVEDLVWIDFPGADGSAGSVAHIRLDSGGDEGPYREGRVLARLGSLETAGRMARVLVEVADPFSLRPPNASAPPLLMDAFVSVEIQGRALENMVTVDRRHVHDGDRVWILSDDGTLLIRTVDPVYAGQDAILLAEGLEAGERLVTSDLSTPVEGMPLRVRGEAKQESGGKAAAAQ